MTFWILAFVLIASAVFVITARRPVHSVVGLLGNFLALAVLYMTLSAEFLSVIQIVVYSGAILVLFLFVIALLSSGVGPFNVGPDRMPKALIPALVIAIGALGFVEFAIVRAPLLTGNSGAPNALPLGAPGKADVFGSVKDFGIALFTQHVLPFEVTAFILMVAVIGVAVLAGEGAPAGNWRRPREPIVKPSEASKV